MFITAVIVDFRYRLSGMSGNLNPSKPKKLKLFIKNTF
jgi:hypothetical protein